MASWYEREMPPEQSDPVVGEAIFGHHPGAHFNQAAPVPHVQAKARYWDGRGYQHTLPIPESDHQTNYRVPSVHQPAHLPPVPYNVWDYAPPPPPPLPPAPIPYLNRYESRPSPHFQGVSPNPPPFYVVSRTHSTTTEFYHSPPTYQNQHLLPSVHNPTHPIPPTAEPLPHSIYPLDSGGVSPQNYRWNQQLHHSRLENTSDESRDPRGIPEYSPGQAMLFSTALPPPPIISHSPNTTLASYRYPPPAQCSTAQWTPSVAADLHPSFPPPQHQVRPSQQRNPSKETQVHHALLQPSHLNRHQVQIPLSPPQIYPSEVSYLSPTSSSDHFASTTFASLPSHSPQISPPLSEVQDDPIPPIAYIAANHRATIGPIPALTQKHRRRTLPPLESELAEDKIDRRKGVRVSVDRTVVCAGCTTAIAIFTSRGKREDVELEIREAYWCLKCVALPKKPVEDDDDSEDDATYADTISAAVDKLQGLTIKEESEVERPPNRMKSSVSLSRKRKADDEIVTCDVCTRDIATGRTSIKATGEDVPFGIEVICQRCRLKYKRCSDCGGSGGPRLGVGKWRSEELFPGSRKTCALSHLRLGTLADMSFDIWAIKDLPLDELDDLIRLCRETYSTNITSGLAVPEMLEPVEGLAKTFAEVERMAIDSWVMVEPMLRIDVEPVKGIRRYIALRWSEPPPRKKNRAKSGMKHEDDESSFKSPPDLSAPTIAVRKGKNLAGFVIGELDLSLGSLFQAIQCPWNMGQTYEFTTVLMQTFIRRIQQDIVDANEFRLTRGLSPFPKLREAWVILFHKKTSKLVRDLVSRRGFMPLEDYLEKYGGDSRNYFPIREVFLPPQFTKGWHTLARPVVENDEWGGKTTIDSKGKKKAEKP